ncbi:MAG: tyrosine-type recombinase/integrase [Acidimicrobiia bacterium]
MAELALNAMHTWLMELGNEGRSPKTIQAYEAEVTETLSSVASQVGVTPEALGLARIKRDHLVAAVADFRVRPDPRFSRRPDRAPQERSPARVSRRLAALRVFFKWCYATGRIPSDPAALLKSPKKAKRLPKALEPDTAVAVMDASIEDARWPERDQLIVVLALTTGLRLEEMATLKVADVSGNPPSSITVIGKGNKERRLPLPEVTQEALAVYLPTRTERLRKIGLEAGTVFVSTRPRSVGHAKDGTPVLTVEATKAGIAYVVDRVLRRMGARRPGGRVHVLRHTFATLGLRPDLRTGQPAYTLRQLQAALGHANLATIQVYTEVTDAELVRAAEAHPLARKRDS